MRTHNYAKLHSLWEPMMGAGDTTGHLNFEDPLMEQFERCLKIF